MKSCKRHGVAGKLPAGWSQRVATTVLAPALFVLLFVLLLCLATLAAAVAAGAAAVIGVKVWRRRHLSRAGQDRRGFDSSTFHAQYGELSLPASLDHEASGREE